MNLVNYYKKIETKDELVSPILEVFTDLINGRYKMFKRHCKALINKFNKSECYGEMILFQRILVNELEKNGEFEEANKLIREADRFILKRNYIIKKL